MKTEGMIYATSALTVKWEEGNWRTNNGGGFGRATCNCTSISQPPWEPIFRQSAGILPRSINIAVSAARATVSDPFIGSDHRVQLRRRV